MNEFINAILMLAREVAKEHHGYVEEDGILLAPGTVELVAELEEANRQRLIEQALINEDRELFMQLTGGR